MTQLNAKLRVCASCERVFWDRKNGCPVCGFAHYGAFWAIGFWPTVLGWVTKKHKYVKPEFRVEVDSNE